MTIRIAVASTPPPVSLDHGVASAIAAVQEAARLGARLVCLPESGLPGHRLGPAPVARFEQAVLDGAMELVAQAARQANVAVIVGTERVTPSGLEVVSVVLGADGELLGAQVKTQLDPSEDAPYIPGSGRHLFTTEGLTFGLAICHEAFRYPEIVRALVLGGASVVFVPHYVTTNRGLLPTLWCDATNPYNEKALLCRALENTVYIAAANFSGSDQGSASCVIGPDGALLAQVEYGREGVVAVDIDPNRADGLLARRFAPERNLIF